MCRVLETDVAEAYRGGRTMDQLVGDTGLSFREVRRRVTEAGVETRPQAPVTPPAPSGLVKHYERGATIRATAKAYQLSYGQTRRMLLNAGVVLRLRGGAH